MRRPASNGRSAFAFGRGPWRTHRCRIARCGVPAGLQQPKGAGAGCAWKGAGLPAVPKGPSAKARALEWSSRFRAAESQNVHFGYSDSLTASPFPAMIGATVGNVP